MNDNDDELIDNCDDTKDDKDNDDNNDEEDGTMNRPR